MIVFGGRIQPTPNTNDVWVLTDADAVTGTSQWINLIESGAPGSPPTRSGHSAVYDPTTNRMIIFGGCYGGCLPTLNDVWVLTNANGLGGAAAWIQLFPGGGPPAGRVRHTAVYDPGSNRMIVFGGQNGGGLGGSTFPEVWILDHANGLGGTPTWTLVSTAGGQPPGQYAPSAVYDPGTNRMTVFGGMARGTGAFTNAVWVLTNANGLGGTPTWINLIPEGAVAAPAPRAFHSAVYDNNTNRMIVFAGWATVRAENDVWVLSMANGLGSTPSWSKLTPSGGPPPAREAGVAVYNPGSNRMAIFSGTDFAPSMVLHNDAWVLSDANGIPPNQPPITDAGVDQTVECASPSGAPVALDGSGSMDADGTIGSYEWLENGEVIATGPSPTVTLPPGTHRVALRVTDDDGATAEDDVTITVGDTRAPTVSLAANPTELWPPNHEMRLVASRISATDACDPAPALIVGVASNEPADGLGDGDTAPDWQVVANGDGTFDPLVRAERSGTGSGRIYSLTATARDASGNSGTASATVTVPLSRGRGRAP